MAKKTKTAKTPHLGAFDPKSFGLGFDQGEAFSLDSFLEYYEKETNPVFYLYVWLQCDRHNIPIPEKVREYLRRSFTNVVELGYKELTKNTAAEDFCAAFEMPTKPGARKPFNLFQIHQRNLLVGGRVAGRIYEKRQRGEKVSEEEIMRKVAKDEGMSFPSVRDAYYGYKMKRK